MHAKKISAIVETERGRDGAMGECSREKGGKAEINTRLIDSTRPHAKLYEEWKYQGLKLSTETFQQMEVTARQERCNT